MNWDDCIKLEGCGGYYIVVTTDLFKDYPNITISEIQNGPQGKFWKYYHCLTGPARHLGEHQIKNKYFIEGEPLKTLDEQEFLKITHNIKFQDKFQRLINE